MREQAENAIGDVLLSDADLLAASSTRAVVVDVFDRSTGRQVVLDLPFGGDEAAANPNANHAGKSEIRAFGAGCGLFGPRGS